MWMTVVNPTGRFAKRPYSLLPTSYSLFDNGLGQDPEARYRVENHQDEHRELAPESASGVAQQTKRDRMRQVDGDHVPHYDEGDLRVPDEGGPDDAVAGLETGC